MTFLKKNLVSSTKDLKTLIERKHRQLNISDQCKLLGLPRSSYYHEELPEEDYNLFLMHKIDELYTEHPTLGSRMMCSTLMMKGYQVNRKRIQRLMGIMGLEAIYCKPRTSVSNPAHKVYPYLLRNLPINKVNQVWSIDITYIRLIGGFMYLVAVLEWYSRYVLSWEISNSLTTDFCINALEKALQIGKPEIFNSDQGAQFTDVTFTSILNYNNIKISMDGRGRALDNVFIERLWRTLKYEDIYLKDYSNAQELRSGVEKYFNYYSYERPHSSLDNKTPYGVFISAQ
jgi:putative transposase